MFYLGCCHGTQLLKDAEAVTNDDHSTDSEKTRIVSHIVISDLLFIVITFNLLGDFIDDDTPPVMDHWKGL